MWIVQVLTEPRLYLAKDHLTPVPANATEFVHRVEAVKAFDGCWRQLEPHQRKLVRFVEVSQ
jgi:hypothetical protein